VSASTRLTNLPLPRVAFLPGRTARPARFECTLDEAALAPERWRENTAWLFGVDLYNHGFAWEAHEVWEPLWLRASDPRHKLFVQALIQCAASALKRALGEPSSSKRLAERACLKFAALESELPAGYMGLAHAAFAADFRTFGASSDADFEARPRLRIE